MKKNNTLKLLARIERKSLLSDKFHSETNNKMITQINIKDIPQSWTKINFKTYPRLKKTYLTKKIPKEKKLGLLMARRRSVRQFSGLPVSLNQLSYLLFSSAGLLKINESIDYSRRPYPSAGARYPLELYPLILNCTGIEKGLYHYNVKENCLELILKKNLADWLMKASGGETLLKKASIIFIITSVFDRTRIKYHDRGYRYILIESGHLAQNIMLLVTELGLGSCAIGGYIDSAVNELLDISSQKEYSLYLLAVGTL
ncbi:MAG: SagB/ThcOx family dehydrogenase [bacterium]